MSAFALPADLGDFARAVREARAPDFDWRAAYARLAATMPSEDPASALLFYALLDDIAGEVRDGKANAYHNHLHTLDTMLAIELLCSAATRGSLPLLVPRHILVLTMLGHDLRHPGGANSPTRDIERMSANLVAAHARRSGLAELQIARIQDLILGTKPETKFAMRAGAPGDLAHYLVGEADVMASLLPGIGLELAADLTQEFAAAGTPVAVPFGAPRARLSFLRAYATSSAPAQALGLDRVVGRQIADLEAASA